MAYRATCHYYKSLIEYPLIWTGDARRVHALGVEIHGRELIDAALAHGKGLVVAALHFGSFAAAVIPMTAHYPFTGMSKPVTTWPLDQLSRQVRSADPSVAQAFVSSFMSRLSPFLFSK